MITFNELSYTLLQGMIIPVLQIGKWRLIKVKWFRKQTMLSTEAEIKGPHRGCRLNLGTSWITAPTFYWITHWEHKLVHFGGINLLTCISRVIKKFIQPEPVVYFQKSILRKYLEMWTDLCMKTTTVLLFKIMIKSVKSSVFQLTDWK